MLRGMAMLTHSRLLEILRYDPETGHFTRLVGRRVGKVTGYRNDVGNGFIYWMIYVEGQVYRAHRLAWFYMTGEWPKALIDHKDCCTLNNRWENLREADHSSNTQNSRIRADNLSGLKGVNFSEGRWKARISVRGEHVHLGLFPTAEAAHAAYKAAAQRMFGEFARLA